eukprot:4103983-Lingulodinium_polyedra.AAC.1
MPSPPPAIQPAHHELGVAAHLHRHPIAGWAAPPCLRRSHDSGAARQALLAIRALQALFLAVRRLPTLRS